MRSIVPVVDSAFCQFGAFVGHVHSSADTPLPFPDVHGQVRGSESTGVGDSLTWACVGALFAAITQSTSGERTESCTNG